jgi:microcystin-dependent protein
MDPFIGEVRMFAGNFAPQGWSFCNGQLLPIAVYDALFTLIGTTYGGDGQTTFALPDLQGRAPIHQGQRPGGINFDIGGKAGVETVTLLNTQMPQHTHSALATTTADSKSPQGKVWSTDAGANIAAWATAPTAGAAMSSNAVSVVGQNFAHQNMQPVLAISYIIALEGIYPPRN